MRITLGFHTTVHRRVETLSKRNVYSAMEAGPPETSGGLPSNRSVAQARSVPPSDGST